MTGNNFNDFVSAHVIRLVPAFFRFPEQEQTRILVTWFKLHSKKGKMSPAYTQILTELLRGIFSCDSPRSNIQTPSSASFSAVALFIHSRTADAASCYMCRHSNSWSYPAYLS